jgi:hypothetical protein
MKSLISIVCNIFFLCSIGFSQLTAWRHASGTAGINIAAIDIFPRNPDTLYALGDAFEISSDLGEHWTAWPIPFTAFDGVMKVDGSNSTTVYASYDIFGTCAYCDSIAVMVTRTAGLEWHRALTGSLDSGGVPSINIDPSDHKTIYAGVGAGRIKRSTNRGVTWQDLTQLDTVANGLTSLAIAPSNDNILYAATYGYIYKSTDKGITWNGLGFPYQNNNPLRIAIDPRNANVLYVAVKFLYSSGGIYKNL